jgi:hypothetical protein
MAPHPPLSSIDSLLRKRDGGEAAAAGKLKLQ